MKDRTPVWIVGFMLLLALFIVIAFPSEPPARAQLAASSGFQYTPITSATNTQVRAAPAMLNSIVINGGTLTGVITVVDTSAANCTGGTTVATIAQPQTAGQIYTYNAQLLNGLCITTAAAVNATVMTR